MAGLVKGDNLPEISFMKQFSLILNLVLLVAVAVLYYLHFSVPPRPFVQAHTGAGFSKDSSGAQHPVIAYVELDSLNNNLNFIKDRKKLLEDEQKRYNNEYEGSIRALQAERDRFIKNSNSITQLQSDEFQKSFRAKVEEVERLKQERTQTLVDRSARMMEEIQSQIRKFMKEYNRSKNYQYVLATGTGLDYMFYRDSALNITPEVIKGLNEQLKPTSK